MKTVKTGKNGKATVTFKPSKPGIIKVAIQGAKACNTQRIGVVGVVEPPRHRLGAGAIESSRKGAAKAAPLSRPNTENSPAQGDIVPRTRGCQ